MQYRLRHRWRDGTTHMLFEGVELVERLAALVPPPRFHTVRYYGILAPAASCRGDVVPAAHMPTPATPGVEPEGKANQACCGSPGPARALEDATLTDRESLAERKRRLSWPQLMQRVFAADVLECPRCGGRLRILAAILSPAAVRAILDCMGLGSRAPT